MATTNLNFFQGKKENLPITNNIEPHSFYMTTDSYDLYYSDENKSLQRLAANPSETIKEIHTFYNVLSKEIPTSYPPNYDITGWTEDASKAPYVEGNQVYSIDCFIYMDGSYKYQEVEELITQNEIDEICGTPIEIFTATKGEF